MNRGEVWRINLDPTVGAEINKSRPAVIVSRNAIGKLPLKIIVPITAWHEAFEQAAWHVPLPKDPKNGIRKKSSADTFQVRSISQQRFVEKLGELSKEKMEEIGEALRISLALD
jgi:mRNA interferase MazF